MLLLIGAKSKHINLTINERRLTLDIKTTCFVDGSIGVSNFACVVSTIAGLNKFNFEGLIAGLPINRHVTLSLLADWLSVMEPGYLSKGFGKHLTSNFCVCVRFHWQFRASYIHVGCSP